MTVASVPGAFAIHSHRGERGVTRGRTRHRVLRHPSQSPLERFCFGNIKSGCFGVGVGVVGVVASRGTRRETVGRRDGVASQGTTRDDERVDGGEGEVLADVSFVDPLFSPPPPSDREKVPTSSPTADARQSLVGSFDVDDALSAWIIARFVFIWVVFGYLAVPTLASVQGVSPPSALPPQQLAAALVVAECGKLFATALMLNSELTDAGRVQSSAPWLRYRLQHHHRQRSSSSTASASINSTLANDDDYAKDDDTDGGGYVNFGGGDRQRRISRSGSTSTSTCTGYTTPTRSGGGGGEQVALGVGWGLAASAAARIADAIVNGEGDEAAKEAAEGGEGLLQLFTASVDDDFIFAYTPALALVVSSVLVAPVLEELFFRGYVLPAAARRVPLPAAISATSALFAAMHFSIRDAASLFVASCAFGAAAAAGGGGLVAPTVAHATYNAGVLTEAALSAAAR